MQVHTFRGPGRLFGFTAAVGSENLPAQFGPWTAFKVLDMHRDEPQAGVDVNTCLDDIESYGFHLTDAHVRVTQQAVGRING